MRKRYKTRLSFGFDSDGNRIRKYFYYDTKDELYKQIEAFRNEIGRPNSETFGAYSKRWLETYKRQKSKRTYNMYRDILKKFQAIDEMQLDEITLTDLQEIINENYKHARTCEIIYTTLDQIFEKAVDEDLVRKSFVKRLELPKYVVHEKEALTEAEIKISNETELKGRERLFVDVLRVYGLRTGEAIALKFSDFDLENDTLCIKRAISFDDNEPFIKDTKTKDWRYLPLLSGIKSQIEALQGANRDDFIFKRRDGRIMSKSALRCLVERSVGKIDAQLENKHITPYTYRHNRVTEMYYSGFAKGKATPKQIAKLFGNSEEMILKRYSHLRDTEKEKVKNLYNGL